MPSTKSTKQIRRLIWFSHVLQAALNPVDLDERQVNAVAARIELDLRLGASFTRFQTLELQRMGDSLAERVISYGNGKQTDFVHRDITLRL